jgi:predicted transcriptional regulator
MINMAREKYPKGIPMYKILAFLNKSKEPKSIPEISLEASMSYNTVRDNIYKLQALGAVEGKEGKYVITEKGKQMLDEFFKEIEKLKNMVDT